LVFQFQLYTPHGFATGVVDGGEKLPPLSATPTVPVNKFAASVIDTGGNLPLV
jgi:hypothetical protein